MTWVIVPAIAALLALFAILVRSGLLRLRDSVHKSCAGLDSLLLERHDLLTELVELCARHMRYEQDALDRVSRADSATFGAAIIERRELYNSAVNLLNVRSQAFPHRMVAHAIGFHAEAIFE